jgi:cell division protein FtsW (lipid II flippase)
MMNPSTSAAPMPQGHYRKFLLTLGISFVIMYVVMYLNTYELDHVYFSLTRFYMTVLMVTAMAVVMLLMMPMMYPNKTLNGIIMGASLTLFVGALIMVRSQTFVNDTRWMKAMIPHHSIAILTSERATIQDPEVRKLADGIIATQKREISEMKALIKRLEQ